jgi:hypothetical protein
MTTTLVDPGPLLEISPEVEQPIRAVPPDAARIELTRAGRS